MQTILGSNGIIGTHIAKTLPLFTTHIRLVSRTPKKVNENDELFAADLLNAKQVSDAVKGSETVYLTVGLPYKTAIWQEQWPIVMNNTIAACKQHGSKLVFFDNIYMYGPVNGSMTETTAFGATSKKGTTRAGICKLLLDEINKGTITAMICRAPEFYGPRPTLSGVNSTVFETMAKGKKPQWLISDQRKRSFIFTPDAAKGTTLLANTADAWNQTWHLPVDNRHPTGEEFMQLINSVIGKEVSYAVIGKLMLKIGGLFNPFAKEIMELLYQWEQDYIFSSEKFKTRFPEFAVTPYEEGIMQTLYSYGLL